MLTFLRVVEVFPPLFPVSRSKEDPLRTGDVVERFRREVSEIRDCADVILVANVKDQRRLKVDSVHAAAMLKADFRLPAAPAVVVRDMNRPQFLSTVLTAVSLGLDSMMIAWGDDYPTADRATNVRDYPDLASAIKDASLIRSRARTSTRFFAPIHVGKLASKSGRALARGRLLAGADLLLAQPPTTDSGETFDLHSALIEEAGLKGKVLLNVFPFKDEADVRRCEKLFGWRLPRLLHEAVSRGDDGLIDVEREIVRRSRSGGFPGVYLTARGNPRVAKTLLS